ncbi:MAGE-domain-containing protein [Hymenopellis radicata]|nr:MAGE-domain-containing protein [Hymenopellis radicata]
MAPRRSQRRAPVEEEEEEDRSMDVDQEDEQGHGTGGGIDDISRRANQLVRLALFYEQKRMVLRRDEITKKVMAGSKSFAPVLKSAQDILSNTFGFELVELKNRNAEEVTEELDEARKATGVKKKGSSGAKSYIVRSKLDAAIIEAAHETDEAILEAEAEDAAPDDDDGAVDEDDTLPQYGSIIAPNEPGAAGVLSVILALVLVSGRCIGDAELRSYLTKLRLSNVAFTSRSTTRSVPLDTYLQTLLRQGYLDRQSLADASKKGGTKGGKSKRVRADEDGGGVKYEWRWGSRAHTEIGEEGIGEFVAEFMVGPVNDEEGEGGGRRQKEREKKVHKMVQGIGRAAGGGLAEFK